MTTTMAHRVLRLLIIEDDATRVEQFRSWIPADVRAVIAPSAGTALGILQRARMSDYGGLMLDHDLQGRARTEADMRLSGSDLMGAIIRSISTDVPILVHSMNPEGASLMVQRLEGAGFSVTRIPMARLTRETFAAWLDEVRSAWED
jgi:hypothetical protein